MKINCSQSLIHAHLQNKKSQKKNSQKNIRTWSLLINKKLVEPQQTKEFKKIFK